MGHSAKFGSYSIMDIEAKKVVSLQLVQSTEVKNSNAMELEGLKRCTTELGNIPVKAFISDMHLQIGKWIRTVWKVSHYYDCWHVVKSITKKLEKLAKTKAFVDIQDWVKSLKYHLYWCVSSSPKDDKESIKKNGSQLWNMFRGYTSIVNTNLMWLRKSGCYQQVTRLKKF
ncbi:uncharacterized protein LOC141904698 isoform X2 [Tubulanus polymorphus]|uniref:uncharacterized protein LOC141904698 isoform X2 n=1 Tax=Tubulanus polymorphus TaxID=672921 RepID=UPI003DA489DA